MVLYALAVPPALLLLWCATYSHRTASDAAALMHSSTQEALSDVYRRAHIIWSDRLGVMQTSFRIGVIAYAGTLDSAQWNLLAKSASDAFSSCTARLTTLARFVPRLSKEGCERRESYLEGCIYSKETQLMAKYRRVKCHISKNTYDRDSWSIHHTLTMLI